MTEENVGHFSSIYSLDLERHYEAERAQVWDAITHPEQISTWMEYPVHIELKMGGAVHFDFGSEGQIHGVVCELDPGKSIAYTWGESIVKWELHQTPEGSRTHFSHIGLTEKNAVELGSGWHAFIDYLGPYLRSAEFPKNQHAKLIAAYQQDFDSCRG